MQQQLKKKQLLENSKMKKKNLFLKLYSFLINNNRHQKGKDLNIGVVVTIRHN